MEVLAPDGPRVDHDETWLTLLDLYRATGRQDRYETAAIESPAASAARPRSGSRCPRSWGA